MERKVEIKESQKQWQVIVSRILWLLAPFIAYFILQRFYGPDIGAFLRGIPTRRGVLNLFILYTVWWGCYVITNRTKLSAILTTLVALVLGLANYFVWKFRGTPLVVADVMSVGTAAKVAGGYRYTLDADAAMCVIYAALYIVAVLVLKSGKGLKWKPRIAAAASFLCLAFGFHYLFFESSYLETHGIFWGTVNGVTNYAENGTALSMMLSWTYVVEKPSGYSPSKVEALAGNYISDQSDAAAEMPSGQKPNIIVIMNETFSDLGTVGELPISEDVMPFVHGLTENTVKGHLYVSVIGGGTANTEFEFLTGSSMAFLPIQSIPYNSYITSELPSFCTALSSQGYGGNIAFHPYQKSLWKRDKVYPLLGFSDFVSIDEMQEEERSYIRSFISDECDYNKLISLYESYQTSEDAEKPFYLFNVTIQNHGGYDSSTMIPQDMVLSVTDDRFQDDGALTFLNLIRKSDQALEMLVNYFKQVDEPTIIVFFGDHMPGISEEFYLNLAGKTDTTWTLDEQLRRFEVPYFIWANYDIEEEQRDMSANYLGAYVLKTAGVSLTGYQKYLLNLMEKVPVVTQYGYIGDDGTVRDLKEESKYTELLQEYASVQYNYLIDNRNRVSSFFEIN